MIYRTQKNVPDVYVKQSRDFQLLGRLIDAIVNDSSFYIDGIRNTISAKTCPSNLLPLLATKIGFYSKYSFPEEQLRGILQAFPYLLKYKGSKRAIYQAIFLFLRLSGVDAGFQVDVRNEDNDSNTEDYTITITFLYKPLKTKILDALFNYLLPPGYVVKYIFTTPFKMEQKAVAIEQDKFQGFVVGNAVDNQLRSTSFDNSFVGTDDLYDDLLSGADTALVGQLDDEHDLGSGTIKSWDAQGTSERQCSVGKSIGNAFWITFTNLINVRYVKFSFIINGDATITNVHGNNISEVEQPNTCILDFGETVNGNKTYNEEHDFDYDGFTFTSTGEEPTTIPVQITASVSVDGVNWTDCDIEADQVIWTITEI